MISVAAAVVTAAGLRDVRSAPPLTIRRLISDEDATCALCLVGSAAGPLPGDDLTLRLDIEAGAKASLIATGATIAQGRAGSVPARIRVEVHVGADASLDADPGPVIVCADAQVEVSVAITLAANATLRWREQVVLGRSGERPGAAVLDWDVRWAETGRPLLRQRVDLTDPELVRWPGLLNGARVLESELTVGPHVDAATAVHSANEVTQKLGRNATLRTLLAR